MDELKQPMFDDHMEAWTIYRHGPSGSMDHMEAWTIWKHGPHRSMDHMEAWTT